MKTALKAVSLIVAILLVGAIVLLWAGIPAGVVNSVLGDRIARDTGARLTIDGATRIGLFPLRLTADNVTLVPPGDQGISVSIERIAADLTLSSVLSREPAAQTVTLTKPVLRGPLIRERSRGASSSAATPTPPRRVPVERIVIVDGAIVLSDPVAKIEQRADGLSVDMQFSADRRVDISGRAQFGGSPATFTAKTRLATASDREPVPFELTIDAPGVMPRKISANGDMRSSGPLITLTNLSGMFGGESFNGWASIDLNSKPVIKVDLDFPRLSFDLPKWHATGTAGSGWSTTPFDLAGLNYLDAQGKLSVAELKIGTLRIAPAALDLTLAAGALKLQGSRLGIGGGESDGDVVVDASGATPDLSLRLDVTNVRARPLLNALFDFDRIDGRLSAKLVLRGTGANPRAVAASVGGTAFTAVTDGEIIGVNVAQMIRSLTASTLNGWQDAPSQNTDLSQLSASFRLKDGQGSTSDLALAGPLVRMTGAGNIDLVTETMAFRVEPKLVMTLQGQAAGGTAPPTPVGLGVPVIIQGPWASPRIYPEISGMLDNPDAAYAQLRQMGQGLFGRDLLGKDLQNLMGPAGAGGGQGNIGETIGNIIQGLGAGQQQAPAVSSGRPPPAPDAGAPSPMNDIMKRLFNR